MEDNKSMEVFAKVPIRKAVLQNALPAMAAMLMVLIYNLADTFFIWADPRRFASGGSLPCYAGFPAVYVCGNGLRYRRHLGDFPRLGRGAKRLRKKGLLVLHVELCCCRGADVCAVPDATANPTFKHSSLRSLL